MIAPGDRSGRVAEMALSGTTCATTKFVRKDESYAGMLSMGERGLLVARPAPHSHTGFEDDAAQAPLPAHCVSGFDWVAPQSEDRHPLKVDTHACEAWTGFGILAGTRRLLGGGVLDAGGFGLNFGSPRPLCFSSTLALNSVVGEHDTTCGKLDVFAGQTGNLRATANTIAGEEHSS
jgi:hypothetical protein